MSGGPDAPRVAYSPAHVHDVGHWQSSATRAATGRARGARAEGRAPEGGGEGTGRGRPRRAYIAPGIRAAAARSTKARPRA